MSSRSIFPVAECTACGQRYDYTTTHICPRRYPIYEHDCDGCVFVGSTEGADGMVDIYFCNQDGRKRSDSETMILRFSSEGSDYTTETLGYMPINRVEIARAIMTDYVSRHMKYQQQTREIYPNRVPDQG